MLNQTCLKPHCVFPTQVTHSQALYMTMPNAQYCNELGVTMARTANHNNAQNVNHATHEMLRQSSNIFDKPLPDLDVMFNTTSMSGMGSGNGNVVNTQSV